MNKEVLRLKILGSLVGTGVGDALGASSEGWCRVEPEKIQAMADKQRTLTYTDDTHMMIGVAESLVENRGFDGEHMARVFVENYEQEPFRGYGPGPPRIFRLIRAGEAWNKAAERFYPGGSYGNGSAMRIAPIGVFYHDDSVKLKRIAYESSQITHAHELGKEGAALQAYAVALATNLEPSTSFNHGDFLRKLDIFVQHEVYKQKLEGIGRLLGKPDKSEVVDELGNGIEAFNSVPAAIYSFLSHPDSFKESVLYAISLGGDTDTIGAMTGAISGAYLGFVSIPQQWKDKLENREHIQELAEKLWLIKIG
jgi:poly(ADP-ribose) glycohydrolase ARH3